MSTDDVKVGDQWGTLKGLETVESIEGEYARFKSGGFWRTSRMLEPGEWFRLPREGELGLGVECEARYESTVRDLQDELGRVAASAHAGAVQHASDLAAERIAGALRVDAIRAAILAGATDSAQRVALGAALCVVEGADLPRAMVPDVCAALLACNEALREARAEVALPREAARVVGAGPAL